MLFQMAFPLVLRIAAQMNWRAIKFMARILRPRQEKDGASCREAIKTAGEIFPDGTTLELIRHTSGGGETSLLRWDGKSATVGQQFEVNGKVYRAQQLNSITLRALRLPGRIAPYGSTRDLFDDIRQLLIKYTDIAENYSWLIAYFILGNWLVDRLSVAPFIFVIAPWAVLGPNYCGSCLASVGVR